MSGGMRESDQSYLKVAYRDWRSGDNEVAVNSRVWRRIRCSSSWCCFYHPEKLDDGARQESREDASWELHFEGRRMATNPGEGLGVLKNRIPLAYIYVPGVLT
jgi:hypothetical protein